MDTKLLKILAENARLSSDQLGIMLDMAPEDVARAIADYEKEGVIRGYKALVNWEKVDPHHVSALIELKVEPKRDTGFDEIAKRVMAFKEVESVYLMSGGYDLAVMVGGSSIQEIAMFVAKRLSPLPSVISTATHFVLSKYKDSGVALTEDEQRDERRSNIL